MADQFTVAIIGCGNIGGIFDINCEADQLPRTHAAAFFGDPRFTLQACVDTHLENALQVQSKWSVPFAFEKISQLIVEFDTIDVVSICNPTAFHLETIESILPLQPKVIFCEKPLTLNSADSEKAISLCQKHNIALAVNHHRRWDKSVLEFKKNIHSNKFGDLRSVVGYYNKGILNNGSHMVDLLLYLLDELTPISAFHATVDYALDDPTLSCALLSKNVPVHFVTGHADDFGLFELQFIFSNKVIQIQAGGLTWLVRDVIDNPAFSSYKMLSGGEIMEGQLLHSMQVALENIYYYLCGDQPLLSTGDSALKAQTLCEQLVSLATHQSPSNGDTL